MFFHSWQAWATAWRNWPVTTACLTAAFFGFGQYLSQFESGELTGDVFRGVIALAVCAACAGVLTGYAVAGLQAMGVEIPSLREAERDRVYEETKHMSFRWMYENSAKGKRNARARAAQGEQVPPRDAEPETVMEYGAELRRNLSVLGLVPPADMATIKAAYRDLVRQHHPDVIGDHGDASRMAEINLAYDWLEAHFKALAS